MSEKNTKLGLVQQVQEIGGIVKDIAKEKIDTDKDGSISKIEFESFKKELVKTLKDKKEIKKELIRFASAVWEYILQWLWLSITVLVVVGIGVGDWELAGNLIVSFAGFILLGQAKEAYKKERIRTNQEHAIELATYQKKYELEVERNQKLQDDNINLRKMVAGYTDAETIEINKK